MRTLYYLLTPYLRYFAETPTVRIRLAYLDHNLLNRRLVNFLSDLPMVHLLPERAVFKTADLVITSVDNEQAIKAAAPAGFHGHIISWTAEDSDDAIFRLYLLIRRLYLKKTDASLSGQNADPAS